MRVYPPCPNRCTCKDSTEKCLTKSHVNYAGHLLPEFRSYQRRPLWDFPVTQHDIDRACTGCRYVGKNCVGGKDKYCKRWDTKSFMYALPNGYKHDVVYNPENKKGTKMPDPYRFYKLQCCSKNLNAHRKKIGTCREVVEFGNPQVVSMNWNKKPEPEKEFEECSCDTSYYEDSKSQARSTAYSCSSKSRTTKKNLDSCDCSTTYDCNSNNLMNGKSTKIKTKARSRARSKLSQKSSKKSKKKQTAKKAHPLSIEFVVGHPPPLKSSSHPCHKWSKSPHCTLNNNTKSLNNNVTGNMDVNYHRQFDGLHKTKGGRNSLKRLSKKYHSISDLERRLHKTKFHAKHHSDTNGHLPHSKADHLSTKSKPDRIQHSPKRNSREGSEGHEQIGEGYRNTDTLEDIEKGNPEYFDNYENPENEENQNLKNYNNEDFANQIHPDQNEDESRRNSATDYNASNPMSHGSVQAMKNQKKNDANEELAQHQIHPDQNEDESQKNSATESNVSNPMRHGSLQIMKNKKKAKDDVQDSNFWGFQSTRHIDRKPDVKVPRMYARDIANNPKAKDALFDEMDESVTVIPEIMSKHSHAIPDPYNTVPIPRLEDIEHKIKGGTILEPKDSDMTKLAIKATPYTKEPPHGLRSLYSPDVAKIISKNQSQIAQLTVDTVKQRAADVEQEIYQHDYRRPLYRFHKKQKDIIPEDVIKEADNWVPCANCFDTPKQAKKYKLDEKLEALDEVKQERKKKKAELINEHGKGPFFNRLVSCLCGDDNAAGFRKPGWKPEEIEDDKEDLDHLMYSPNYKEKRRQY